MSNNNYICPYCSTKIDEHPASECGDAWLAKLLGWDVAETPTHVINFPVYTLKDKHNMAKYVPPFTTSLDAQAEYVWPVIIEQGMELELFDYKSDTDQKAWRMLIIYPDQESILGHADTPALASWRACTKYLILWVYAEQGALMEKIEAQNEYIKALAEFKESWLALNRNRRGGDLFFSEAHLSAVERFELSYKDVTKAKANLDKEGE